VKQERLAVVVVVPTYKIAYMAIPKAACSSVKAALARIDPDVTIPPEAATDFQVWHRIYPTRRYNKNRWQSYRDPEWFSFTVVRDPAKRLMAAYTNRVVELRELHNSRRLQRGDFDLPMDPDPDFFFQHLDEYREASSSVKHHTFLTSAFTGPLPWKFTKVYRTQDLGDLARDLSDRVGQGVVIPRENASTTRLDVRDLSDKTKDALRPRFERDYAHLAEFYDNPLA